RIRVTIAERVGYPATLTLVGNSRRSDGTEDMTSPSCVFPTQSRAEQLVPPLSVDLVQQGCRRLSGSEGWQARFRIVDAAIAGAIGPHRIDHRLYLHELPGVDTCLCLDPQRIIREVDG